mgnify:CR=1 FL=1
MRSSIRLALPVVAAAATFTLAGCADDDGHGTFGAIGGGGDGAPLDAGDLPDDVLDDLEDLDGLEEQDATDGGADAGSTDGGSGDIGGSDDLGDLGDLGGSLSGGAGGGASDAGFDGDWYVDPNDQDNSHNLFILGETVTFIEDMSSEGDYCPSGTFSDGQIDLGDCLQLGSRAWSDTQGTATLNPDGTMTVVWASGLEETYVNASRY